MRTKHTSKEKLLLKQHTTTWIHSVNIYKGQLDIIHVATTVTTNHFEARFLAQLNPVD